MVSMMIRVLAVACVLLLSAEASAQTCLGLPSFSEGLYQASGFASFTDGAQRLGGGVAIGSDDIFGGGTLAFTNFSDVEGNATSFSANAGATFVLSDRERIDACPVASVIISGGPDSDEVDVTGVGLRAGGRLGLVAAQSGNLDVVPTFGLDIAYDRVTAEFLGVDTSASDTYVIVRAGVGLNWNKRLGFLPLLSVPLGLDGSDAEFSFIVTYAFGK
jgi:hypothetical protein